MKTITCEEAQYYAQQNMDLLFEKVPFAREFNLGEKTHRNYYIRHLMETVLRIRLNNEVDAYCLYKIGYKNDRLAQKLAQYLAEELGHENFFTNDLKSFGVSINELNDTKPFFATEKLIGYLYHSINQDGPLPTMVWNWFVEWYSDNYNKKITAKASQDLGKNNTAGFVKHIDFDDDHDHVSLMFNTVQLAASQPGDGEKVKHYLKNFIDLIGDYFQALYDATNPLGYSELQNTMLRSKKLLDFA